MYYSSYLASPLCYKNCLNVMIIFFHVSAGTSAAAHGLQLQHQLHQGLAGELTRVSRLT